MAGYLAGRLDVHCVILAVTLSHRDGYRPVREKRPAREVLRGLVECFWAV